MLNPNISPIQNEQRDTRSGVDRSIFSALATRELAVGRDPVDLCVDYSTFMAMYYRRVYSCPLWLSLGLRASLFGTKLVLSGPELQGGLRGY